jgi:hypothetical protein
MPVLSKSFEFGEHNVTLAFIAAWLGWPLVRVRPASGTIRGWPAGRRT